ncbi:hypothetical protein [Nocardioides campestrisoli]|uniref:hypothetical protein n=1 Tax=Nocardioides campestrisoli TaxID=2736757 RepID=UPI00163DB2F1|nr:hypothetical protein [Nocardioides campestrisoli]
MIRLLLLAVLVVVLVATAMMVLAAGRGDSRRRDRALTKVRQVTDLAYHHDEISPALAGAVIHRTRGLGPDTPAPALESALDDVLDLARGHRAEEPDLAAIVIDTVRGNELT